jgi:beta-glucanase (GH16 family)
LGWGEPVRADEFDAGTGQWSIYDGPGHAGEGRRSPSAVSVRDGVLTITGDPSGTTAGMSWGDGRRYGRWEARARAPAGDRSYNALLLLWPDAENWPEGGEIDFMEIGAAGRQEVDVFLHYGEDNEQKHGRVETDATRWHNWAVEWTPTSITTFLDGRKWYGTTDRAVQPPGPMHLCIQLDWFPSGSGTVRESTMEVDWVREYDLGP